MKRKELKLEKYWGDSWNAECLPRRSRRGTGQEHNKENKQ